jgi:hypothetical protein
MLSLCSSASSAALLLSAGGGDTGGAPAGRIGRKLVSSVAYLLDRFGSYRTTNTLQEKRKQSDAVALQLCF